MLIFVGAQYEPGADVERVNPCIKWQKQRRSPAPSRNNGVTRAILCSLRRRIAERSVGGWRPDRVCSSVCLHDAFHVPRISLPFISPPPLCRFRVRVQPASRISLQLVLVQILIPKGWLGWGWGWRRLTNLASEKTRGRSRREESGGGAGVAGGRSSPRCLPRN